MTPSRGTLLSAVALAAVAVVAVARLPDAPAAFVVALAVVLVVLAPHRHRLASPTAGSGGLQATGGLDAVAPLLAPLREGVVLLDSNLTVVAVNPAAERIFRRPAAEMQGQSLIRAARDHNIVQLAREGGGASQEFGAVGGQVLRAAARRVEAGAVRLVLTVEDVTELRRAERARSDLVANVSHELRTPLAAARAVAETLDDGVPDEQQRAAFQRQLTGEIVRLGAMVERLLQLSRLESRAEQFALESLSPGDLLATATERIAPLARQRDCRVLIEECDVPAVVADRERALEVLTNLLDNALRHSPPSGSVVVRAVPEGAFVRFEVRDDGLGILPNERERVFERFYTGDRARTAGEETGTGLGLAIAQHIVSRLGGRIWVADASPGATLCFTLPLAE